MLTADKQIQLQNLIGNTTREEWLWISGYLAALATQENAVLANPSPGILQTTVLYATETGNSKKAATSITTLLKKQGIKCRLFDVAQYDAAKIEQEQQIILVISTQGEGEPPVTALPFLNYLQEKKPGLNQLKFGVLALGSRSYPLFCQAGIDAEQLLKQLGAKPIIPTGFCDDDYEPVADAWTESLLQVLPADMPASNVITRTAQKAEGKKNYAATLGSKVLLNDGGERDVMHFEFDLSEDVVYTPGNAIGVIPHNNSNDINTLLKLLRLKATDEVQYKNKSYSAEKLFTEVVSVNYLSSSVMKKYAQVTQQQIPDVRMNLADLLRIYPWTEEPDARQLIDILNPLSPRLYTISSAPSAHTGQLHLTVAAQQFEQDGQTRQGLASQWLLQMKTGTKLNWFLHQQKNFQLPRNDRHLIMIAESTGIAPFRSMLYERDASGASGQNMLLFAGNDYTSEFYYQSELQTLIATGGLQHLHVAFEQRAPVKKSIEEIILEQAKAITRWLDVGAYLFISGRKQKLMPVVEASLVTILAAHHECDAKEAEKILKDLNKEGRYATELY